MRTLAGKTLFITGASRGIGLAIALRAARDGANIVVAAKSDQPHPRLAGTIHTAAESIRTAGGQALACTVDVRDEHQVHAAVDQAVQTFGGIDIVVNNASALFLADTEHTPLRRFDLLQEVNSRGTFVVTQACLPHLRRATNAHILTLSPPLNLDARWLGSHLPYTLSKYGMTLLTLGFAAELATAGIAANALWPATAIATAAVENLLGGREALRHCRTPEIVAEAAWSLLTRESRTVTGQCFTDEALLRAEGCLDFARYAVDPTATLQPDFFL